MHIVKLLAVLFLGLYLILVGLGGLGVNLGFVTPGLLGFLALAAGVLFLVKGILGYCCGCKSCDKPHDDRP